MIRLATYCEIWEPVISVDAKKKENIGNFKNDGAEYSRKKEPTKVLDKELGKVAPYGIYDMNRNKAFVNLGISHDTAAFAVESIPRWWQTLGRNTYPTASKLLINSDNGGSNGSRTKLWKKQLQQFANTTGLDVHISHFPPGISKWNKIKHKMFCFISKNWRGNPLISVETAIDLISNTTTAKGLKVVCIKDENTYKVGTKVTDEERRQRYDAPPLFDERLPSAGFERQNQDGAAPQSAERTVDYGAKRAICRITAADKAIPLVRWRIQDEQGVILQASTIYI
jgi:hypothetical protein